MMDVLEMPCVECGDPVDVTTGNPWVQYVGVARKRDQGGLNDLKLKRPTGRFMCDRCVTDGLDGLTPGQQRLLER